MPCSWDDPLCDAGRVHALAAAWRAQGRPVVEQAWAESEHVAHLRR